MNTIRTNVQPLSRTVEKTNNIRLEVQPFSRTVAVMIATILCCIYSPFTKAATTDNDPSALYHIVSSPTADKSLTASQQYLEYHEASTALRRYPSERGKLSTILINMAENETQAPVLRDYAIQHISAMVADDGFAGDRIILVLVKTTKIKENTLAGTALRGLCHISENHPDMVSEEQLENIALTIIQDSQYDPSAHTVAIQTLVKTGCRDVAPLIHKIAKTETSTPLRIAAITALGTIGGKEDIQLLKNIANDTGFFAETAKKSLKKIDNKHVVSAI